MSADSEHWDGVFTEKADEETSWFEPAPVESLDMMDGQTVTPLDSVIDVGAGTSPPVDALVSRGHHDVTVLDISKAALDRSRQRLGHLVAKVDWLDADVTVWRPTRKCDVWHDRAVFHFLTDPNEQAGYRQALRTALAPGGCSSSRPSHHRAPHNARAYRLLGMGRRNWQTPSVQTSRSLTIESWCTQLRGAPNNRSPGSVVASRFDLPETRLDGATHETAPVTGVRT